MSSKDEARIFVGGLSWDTTERHLESTFSRFGKVLDVQIMVERDTGRPRGFGFVTFSDDRAVETAIDEMHGRELDGRLISVNKAEPKVASDGPGYGYGGGGGGYSSGGRGGYGGDRPPPVGRSECFKCGRSGHWARDCTAGGGSSGSRFSSRSRYSPGGGGGGGRGDRFGGSDRYADRYDDDRYDGGRYGDRDRYDGGRYGDRDRTDNRDTRYGGSGRDRYGSDRYASSDRYGGTDRYPQNGYSKDRGYDRDGPARGGGSDRYGSGGPTRYGGGGGGGGGGYRERPGPYDRPSRGGRGSSYDDRY